MLAFADEHQSFSFPFLYPLSCLSKGLWRGRIFLTKILVEDFPAKTNVSDTQGYCFANGCVELS